LRALRCVILSAAKNLHSPLRAASRSNLMRLPHRALLATIAFVFLLILGLFRISIFVLRIYCRRRSLSVTLFSGFHTHDIPHPDRTSQAPSFLSGRASCASPLRGFLPLICILLKQRPGGSGYLRRGYLCYIAGVRRSIYQIP